jgi:hypothetical protein
MTLLGVLFLVDYSIKSNEAARLAEDEGWQVIWNERPIAPKDSGGENDERTSATSYVITYSPSLTTSVGIAVLGLFWLVFAPFLTKVLLRATGSDTSKDG